MLYQRGKTDAGLSPKKVDALDHNEKINGDEEQTYQQFINLFRTFWWYISVSANEDKWSSHGADKSSTLGSLSKLIASGPPIPAANMTCSIDYY